MNVHTHFLEPTQFSTTETVNEPQEECEPPSPSSISPFTGSGIQTTSPNPPHIYRPTREHTLDPRALPPIIPPEHDSRTLVLCFDGTGDQFDADNSNIVQLVSLLKKNDRNKQMVYYQAGIGTYTSSSAATPLMSSIQKTLDEMVAWNLDSHVMGGYEFLMQNYIEGDKICIFGFSRGAYTARSLAGMLHKIGLLPADNVQQIPFAYKMYTRVDHIGWEQSNGFKKAFCTDVTIEFLGVWDTVDSVGLIPKRLPFTTSNVIVRHFRHAVALDERRAKFKANLWNRPTKHEKQLGIQVDQTAQQPLHPPESPLSPVNEKAASDKSKGSSTPSSSNFPKLPFINSNGQDSNGKGKGQSKPRPRPERSHTDQKLDEMEKLYSGGKERLTDIEEVWFAGCHCDVGGGSVSNKTRHSLARIPLRWMIRECFKTGTGIMFHTESLKEIGLDPASLFPVVTPRPPPLPLNPSEHKIRKPPAEAIPVRLHATLTKKRPAEIHAKHAAAPIPFLGSEEEEELHDALSPAYDQLKIKKFWWFLEIIPLHLRYQRGNNEWVTRVGSNLARPRFIPKQIKNGVKVHRSVKIRMDAQYEDEKKNGKRYRPKAHLRVEPTWID